MRVLIVAPYPPMRDGIGVYAAAQADELRSSGHEVSVLSPPQGAGDMTAPFRGGRAFLRAASIGGRFDRVVVHFQPSLYYAPRRPVSKVLTSLAFVWLALRRRHRVEVVVHEADPPIRWRPDYVLLRQAFRLAGTLSFHTEAERRTFERAYRIRVPGHLVPHLARAAAPGRAEARKELGLAADDVLLVCAGFVQPSKGFDRAIEAFARNGARPNGKAKLFIVGSVREDTGENRSYLDALRARAAATPGVEVVDGYLPDDRFDLWLAAADRVVLPYRRSWSSGVLARAHALGTPAIVTAVGGLAEQATENDVVVRDDEELAVAIRDAVGPQPAPEDVGAHHHESDWDPELEPPVPDRRSRRVLVGLIIVSVVLAALAQLTLKHGMNQVTSHGEVPLSLSRPSETVRRIALNVSVWAGLFTFVLSASVWLIVLSRTSLSFAYPFASLTYVLILLFDRVALHEPISGLRYGGVALIIAGLLLISRTHHTT